MCVVWVYPSLDRRKQAIYFIRIMYYVKALIFNLACFLSSFNMQLSTFSDGMKKSVSGLIESILIAKICCIKLKLISPLLGNVLQIQSVTFTCYSASRIYVCIVIIRRFFVTSYIQNYSLGFLWSLWLIQYENRLLNYTL